MPQDPMKEAKDLWSLLSDRLHNVFGIEKPEEALLDLDDYPSADIDADVNYALGFLVGFATAREMPLQDLIDQLNYKPKKI